MKKMFNTNGYTVVRSQTLPDGEYECIIRSAEEKNGNYGNYIEVTVQARGKKGWTPNKILLNEAPVLGKVKNNGKTINDDDLRRWNREMTTFFDCFGITPGNFIPETWVNKIGWCKVAPQYDSNEPDNKSKKYKALYPQVHTQEEVSDPTEYTPAPETETPPIVNEDIPF